MNKTKNKTNKMKNITRYDYTKTDFQGWRYSKCIQGVKMVRYFSDKKWGGKRKSLNATMEIKGKVEDLLLVKRTKAGNVHPRVIAKFKKLMTQKIK